MSPPKLYSQFHQYHILYDQNRGYIWYHISRTQSYNSAPYLLAGGLLNKRIMLVAKMLCLYDKQMIKI